MSFFESQEQSRAEITKYAFRYAPITIGPLVLLLHLLESHDANRMHYAGVIALMNLSIVLDVHPRIRAWRNRYFS